MKFARMLSKSVLVGCLALATPVLADDASDLAAAGKFFEAGEYAKGLPLLQGMVDRGSALGMRALAIAYLRGEGVGKDEKKGFDLMTKAANAGLPAAQHDLGAIYLNGVGVEKNQDTAIQWFRKAADQNYGVSWHALGRITADPKQQEDFFRRAAKLATVGAMLDLAQVLTKQAEAATATGPKLKALTEAYQWIVTALAAVPVGPQRDEVHRIRLGVEGEIKKVDAKAADQLIADARKMGEATAAEFRAAAVSRK